MGNRKDKIIIPKTKLEKIETVADYILHSSIWLTFGTLCLFLIWFFIQNENLDAESETLMWEWGLIHIIVVLLMFISYVADIVLYKVNISRTKKMLKKGKRLKDYDKKED